MWRREKYCHQPVLFVSTSGEFVDGAPMRVF